MAPRSNEMYTPDDERELSERATNMINHHPRLPPLRTAFCAVLFAVVILGMIWHWTFPGSSSSGGRADMAKMTDSEKRRFELLYDMNPEIGEQWIPIYKACRKRLKATNGSTAEDTIDLLNERDQTYLYVSILVAEVYNGGLMQWFDNLSGDRVEETLEALEKIGARKAHVVVTKAIALFPDGRLPRDQATRRKVTLEVRKDHPEIRKQITQLSYEFQETGENLLKLLLEYWERTEPENAADTDAAGPPE